MDGYFPPELDKDAFNCPFCGVYAAQFWSSNVVYGSESESYAGSRFNVNGKIEGFKVSKCSHCHQLIIWNYRKMLFPRKMTVPDPSNDISDNIKEIYIEAGEVPIDSPRASGALIRIALELLLQSINKNTMGLNENINKLIESQIPVQLIKALTILRVNGNDIMHTGEIKILEKKEDVTYLFDLFNMIVEELITRPRKLDESYNRIPESKRKQIENKK